MPDAEGPICEHQQRLMEAVQEILYSLAEISRATAEAIAHRNENLTRELDVQAEKLMGQKERALGALRQHRKEHGC